MDTDKVIKDIEAKMARLQPVSYDDVKWLISEIRYWENQMLESLKSKPILNNHK